MLSSGRYVRGPSPDDRTVGGKARGVARLAAMGLPVPPAIAITDTVFRALIANGPPLPRKLGSAADLRALEAAREALAREPWPTGWLDELEHALEALGAAAAAGRDGDLLSVRSSIGSEDVAGALAAGIYTSRLRVRREAVPDAVRDVLVSALHPAAFAYRRAHGLELDSDEVAVLIHSYVDATAQGAVVYDPAADDAPRIELTTEVPHDRAPHLHSRAPSAVSSAISAALSSAISAGARVAAGAFGPIEMEWVAQGDQVLFLQLRPFTPPRSPQATPATAETDWAALARDGWMWDFGHNPAPLSPAQAGLVALVDQRCRIGIRQRVVNGYLFYRPSDAGAARPPTDIATARATFEALRLEAEARIATLGPAGAAGAEPALEAALNLFLDVYEPLFAVVQPAQRAAIDRLSRLLSEHGLDPAAELPLLLAGVPSAATERAAAAGAIAQAEDPADREAAMNAYIARFGDESPRWDVLEPTYAENPAPILALANASTSPEVSPEEAMSTRMARTPTATTTSSSSGAFRRTIDPAHAAHSPGDRIRDRLPPTAHHELALRLADARAAAALGEDDDALYAKVQATVRRALLALGDRLLAEGALDRPDDIFFIPLEVSRALAAGAPARGEELLPSITAARHGHTTARARSPAQQAARDRRSVIVRGVCGAPGQAIGRAVHHVPGRVPLSGGGAPSILLAATLLPTELPLLPVDAIVVEHGSPLGHVACQARERGIPALVQAQGALANIPEGTWIVVDADRGTVVLL